MPRQKKNVQKGAVQSQGTPIPQLLGLPAANGSEVHPSLGIVLGLRQLPRPGLCLSHDAAWDKCLADPGIQRPSVHYEDHPTPELPARVSEALVAATLCANPAFLLPYRCMFHKHSLRNSSTVCLRVLFQKT